MDCSSESAPERTSEPYASLQCPNERKPIFFSISAYSGRRPDDDLVRPEALAHEQVSAIAGMVVDPRVTNVDLIRARMPDAPVKSGRMLFDPEVVARFADCGVSFLDSPTDVVPMVLAYLGYSVDSEDPKELEDAERVLKSVRPYIRYFSSTKMLIDLPNSETCVAMSWSGDYATARTRAREAGVDINLAYSVPSEGSIGWYDGMFIPADAPHPDTAHAFIDFILRPDVIAAITNFIDYANAVPASNPLIRPETLSDPAVYPTPDILAVLQPKKTLPPKIERLRTRIMARVKTGL